MGMTDSDLERMLFDETAEPRALPLSLLEKITHGFSDNLVTGTGGFAVVYKGILNNGAIVAVKRLSSMYIYDKEFHGEVESLMKVKHRNIVRFLGYCADTKGSMEMYNEKFVMAETQQRLLCFEYLPKGCLEDYIQDASGGLGWSKRYKIIKGICEGLSYLHRKNILHLDLKPANILMDADMMPKITDFGQSRRFEEEQTRVFTKKITGTIGYFAPEFINQEITYKFDLYSLGVIIKEILTGKKGYQVVENILESWRSRSDASQSEQIRVCAEIGIECTDVDPTKRPSIKRIIDRLLETESSQVIPAHEPNEVILVDQFALYFSFEPNKVTACPLKLTNKTNRHVAFRLMDKNGESFLRLPLHGTVPPGPGSSYTLIVTTQEQNDESQICSTALILATTTIKTRKLKAFQRQPDNFFHQAKIKANVVQEVTLEAFCIPPREEIHLSKCMTFEEGMDPKALPLSLLEEITNGFSRDHEIGRGGFSVVYKGTLDNGTIVAIKRLRNVYNMDDKEFQQEVECLMKVKHKNIVQFLGYCAEKIGTMVDYSGELVMEDVLERLLCFEHLPKGTLGSYIKDSSRDLEWSKRYKIIKGICEGLNYLHQKKILHLGLEPGNILLDENMMPKIIGFSHSRCLDERQTRIIATAVFGRMRYLAPEFTANKEITYKSDLYSLGVIILEILAGKRSYDVAENVLESWRNKTDRSLWRQIKVCIEIGRECTRIDPSKRPISMMYILDRLFETDSTNIIPDGGPSMGNMVPPEALYTPRGEMIESSKMKSKPHHVPVEHVGSKSHRVTFQYLKDITNNFSEERIIGRGGFGVVYKGVLPGGKTIAVKKLVLAISSSQEQFENEVNHLMKLEHTNIVRLEGHCHEMGNLHMAHEGKIVFAQSIENFLCFELLPNGSLDRYISDASSGLNWKIRWKIIEGISSGLRYLHEQSNGPIIHLDLKPANILLDENMLPKIADFGQSRFIDRNQTKVTVTICGTQGYMSPEYIRHGIVTPMSDIFSLGVIIVEVITGHKDYPYDIIASSEEFIEYELQKWRNVLKNGPEYASLEIYCQQIRKCLQIGLLCVNHERTKRPTMKNVINMLQGFESTNQYITNEMEEEKKKEKKKEGTQRTLWWRW